MKPGSPFSHSRKLLASSEATLPGASRVVRPYRSSAHQDCGTTFSWVTRAMGPWAGWIGGWAICVTGILVVGSLADVAARYTYLFLGLDDLAGSKVAITVFAVIIIAAMTVMCVIGTELSAHFQDILIIAQVGALLLFAVVALATIWYVPLNFLSENFLFDTLSALSLMIAFYYALTGFACAIYYRHELLKSAKNLVFIGVAPVLGALILAYLFFRSMIDLANPDVSHSGGSVFSLGVPLVIGLGFLLLGVILEVLWRLGGHESFFGRTPETVPPEIAEGRARVQETTGAPPEEH
jgi:amino acid transporter